MDTQRRLDDILNRDIGLQWFEAIAVVQAVCEHMLAHGPADAFPLPAEVAIAADGSVAVLGHRRGPAVAAAGHLLAGIVGDDVPVRLRLAITEATTTESPYRHLAAFSEALTYFERPGRRDLIAAIHARAAAAPVRSAALLPQAPARESSPASHPRQAAPRRRGLPLAPVLLGAGAVLAAAVWMVPNSRDVSGVLSALVDDRGSEETPAPVAARRPPNVEPRRAAKPWRVRSQTAALPSVLVTARLEPPPVNRQAALAVFEEVVEIPASAPSGATDPLHRIYSAGDGFVSPPRPVRPQLPPEPPFDPGIAPPTELELVIAATGLVDSAKLRSRPRNINEFMLVSAAKAWVFEPAELDGRGVRYRLRVRLILP